MMLITATLDTTTSMACSKALLYGHDVTVLYIGNEENDQVKKRFDQRVHVYQITTEQRVEEVLAKGTKG